MNPLLGESLGIGPVTVFGSDNSVRPDLVPNLNASGTVASVGISAAAPSADAGIAGLVTANKASLAKGYTK